VRGKVLEIKHRLWTGHTRGDGDGDVDDVGEVMGRDS
jgi:hypothetical protein